MNKIVIKIFTIFQRDKQAFINPIIFVILLFFVICSEYIGFYSLNDKGFGFDVFLYYPFDYALLLLSFLIFVAGSIKTYSKESRIKFIDSLKILGMAILWSVFWFVVTFIVLVKLHISLGGTL